MGNSRTRKVLITFLPVVAADLQGYFDSYLQSRKTSRVRSLKELVDWNFAHKEEALTAGKLRVIPTPRGC